LQTYILSENSYLLANIIMYYKPQMIWFLNCVTTLVFPGRKLFRSLGQCIAQTGYLQNKIK
jgi:hypothetical protein